MTEPAVFLFDGDCAFCTRCARFLQRRLTTPVRIVAWQTIDLHPLGVTAEQCEQAVQYVSGGRVSAGPSAIADLLRTAAGPERSGRGAGLRRLLWRATGALLAQRWVLALAWPVYRWVARHRHQFPGGSAACELPRPAGARPAGAGPSGDRGEQVRGAGPHQAHRSMPLAV